MMSSQIQIKDLKKGDIVLDASGVKVEVTSIKESNSKGEMLITLNDLEGGPSRLGTAPKESYITLIERG